MPEFNVYKIVGFDLRQGPILDFGAAKKLGEHWPKDGPANPRYPPTISEQTWPRSSKCGDVEHPKSNGINLLWLPDSQIVDSDAISVAFSLRSADAAIFDKDSWVLPIDEGISIHHSAGNCSDMMLPTHGWATVAYMALHGSLASWCVCLRVWS